MLDRRSFVLATMAGALVPIFARSQTPGVTASEIKIGNSFAYSGPASSYATHAKTAAAYFKMINEQGGIAGRKLNFLSYDDGAVPPRAIEQVRRLVEQDQVAILFNTFGTASNTAVARYINDKKIPQLFVYSGAHKFSDPKTYPWTLGWQPSYRVEGQIYAKYARAAKPGCKIGIIYQNDDFGKDYVAGVRDVLGADPLVKTVSHELSDASVDSQLLTLHAGGIDVLISATSPKFVAMTIRKLADLDKKPLHIISNVSTSVSSVMTPAGIEKGIGTVSSSYLKDPNDPVWADDQGLRDWRAFMTKYYPEGDLKDINNLIGYCFAFTLVKVLQACGNDFSRENIMKQATSMNNVSVPGLLPGIALNTSSTDYRPIRQLQMTRFDGKSWQRLGSIIKGADL
ncbi:MAG: ABC transporter substrate-binding protein [Pseudomonadota bacterium]